MPLPQPRGLGVDSNPFVKERLPSVIFPGWYVLGGGGVVFPPGSEFSGGSADTSSGAGAGAARPHPQASQSMSLSPAQGTRSPGRRLPSPAPLLGPPGPTPAQLSQLTVSPQAGPCLGGPSERPSQPYCSGQTPDPGVTPRRLLLLHKPCQGAQGPRGLPQLPLLSQGRLPSPPPSWPQLCFGKGRG